MKPMIVLAALAVAGFSCRTADAQTPYAGGDPQAGRAFALETCTPCHVVASDQLAPQRFATAPDFRAIANTKGMTGTSIAAFLRSPHPTMPNLILSPEETRDVIAYILSLRTRP